MKRRSFLRNTGLASTSIWVPSFIQTALPKTDKTFKKLIVIQLSGGNDGLNTIVPYTNDIYYANRPGLGLKKDDCLRLTDDFGTNGGMTGFQSLYENGLISIINNVGYPNPNRSHFRSMDIWHTASNSDQYLKTGWLGRYLDNYCLGSDAHHVMELDDSLSLALKGNTQQGFALKNPKNLFKSSSNEFIDFVAQADHASEDNINYLYKTIVNTQSSAEYLFEKAKTNRASNAYPKNSFGKDLQLIANLILSDSNTQIYYASLSGFDTHAFQKNAQNRLLKVYSQGLKALVDDLSKNGVLEETLILTFSEFGRRVKQNASSGTDHGKANNVFVTGGRLQKPGIWNQDLKLDTLDDGDLSYATDFRQVYATILEDWLEVESDAVLGQPFDKLELLD